jgi:hypothetical protein
MASVQQSRQAIRARGGCWCGPTYTMRKRRLSSINLAATGMSGQRWQAAIGQLIGFDREARRDEPGRERTLQHAD